MRVLITGATGLVGKSITRLCHARGIEVNYLTTSRSKIVQNDNYKGFFWDPSTGEIDPACLHSVGSIINLAGASVFQPWTEKNKAKILNSRVESLRLLFKTLKENNHQVGQLVSASAIGIYPSSFQKMRYENDPEVSNGFLGKVVQKWESAADDFEALGLRVAKIRIGLVLAKDGGALPVMARPLKYGLGAPIASGAQWQSWIHLNDLSRIFIHVFSNGLTGIYNGVAPNPVTNQELTEQLAKSLNKSLWLPKVPAVLIKMVTGKMSSLVLDSQLVSSDKIQATGFEFHYINFQQALEDLWHKKTGH
jgi:uncharacterized protein